MLEALQDTRPSGDLKSGPKRAMLGWMRKSFARVVLDNETGEMGEAGQLVADCAVTRSLKDPELATAIIGMTLRAEEAAAQADDGEGDTGPQAPRVVTLRLGEAVVEPLDG